VAAAARFHRFLAATLRSVSPSAVLPLAAAVCLESSPPSAVDPRTAGRLAITFTTAYSISDAKTKTRESTVYGYGSGWGWGSGEGRVGQRRVRRSSRCRSL